VGLASWFRALGSERSYLEKGTLAVPSMLGPRCEDSVYDWWKTQDHIPSVRKMAYDHLCVPAMSSETERCFRGTKLGIPETRKRLDWAVIEASEVSRGLMKYGVL
jgi:hypothetical protein